MPPSSSRTVALKRRRAMRTVRTSLYCLVECAGKTTPPQERSAPLRAKMTPPGHAARDCFVLRRSRARGGALETPAPSGLYARLVKAFRAWARVTAPSGAKTRPYPNALGAYGWRLKFLKARAILLREAGKAL